MERTSTFVIPRVMAPKELIEAFDRMMAAYEATRGKGWEAPEWDHHQREAEEYRRLCRKHGFMPKRRKGNLSVYPRIENHLSNEEQAER